MTGRQGRVRRLVAVSMAVAVASFGCREEAGPDTSVPELQLTSFDTIITLEGGRLGVVSDLALDSAGRVWLTDRVNDQLLALDPSSGDLLMVGRQGEGPGEFQRPEAVAVSKTGVFVFDFGNRRIQLLNQDGSYLSSTPLDLQPFLPVDVNGNGTVVTPTLGREGSLVASAPFTGEGLTYVGRALAARPSGISRTSLREQAMRGEIPVEFQNNVLPILAEDGAIWLVLQGEGILRHYGQDGRLRWSRRLQEPEVGAAIDEFLMAWSGDEGPSGIPVPMVATHGRVVEENLWLRIGPGREGTSVIAVLDGETGMTRARYVLELETPAGAFAVDPDAGWLYVALPDEARLLRTEVELP